jgi:hypothetical protein
LPAKLDKRKLSTKGRLFTRVFLTNLGTEAPSAASVALDFDRDIKFKTKGLKECAPASITGRPTQDAIAACKKARVGSGLATALGAGAAGPVTAFNGRKQGGSPTLLLHSVTVGLPVVLQGTLVHSPVGGRYGKRLNVPVSYAAGGPVPPGIVITDFSSPSSQRCSDGTFSFQGTFRYVNAATQVVQDQQTCATK